MGDLSDVIRILPPMKSGNELLSALEVLPEYDAAICDADAPVRLMARSDLYRVYVPNQMSLEIYSKLYLALMRSLQKKGTKLAVQQQNQNFKAIMQQEYSGIMGRQQRRARVQDGGCRQRRYSKLEASLTCSRTNPHS